MDIKNLKVNVKRLIAGLGATFILVSSGGCAEKSTCEIEKPHLHRYEKAGIVRYLIDEDLKVDGFADCKEDSVKDSAGNVLPRKAEKESIQKRNKALVNYIFEEYLCKAVCSNPALLEKWDIENNALLEQFKISS